MSFWQDAYTQFEFVVPGAEKSEYEEWKFWLTLQLHEMMEESNGFCQEWGFQWLDWYTLFAFSMFMVFGPFLMCWQSLRTYRWMRAKQEAEKNRGIEEDPEFEQDEDTAEIEPAEPA